MGEPIESAKKFQWALELSSNNKKISESKLIEQHTSQSGGGGY